MYLMETLMFRSICMFYERLIKENTKQQKNDIKMLFALTCMMIPKYAKDQFHHANVVHNVKL